MNTIYTLSCPHCGNPIEVSVFWVHGEVEIAHLPGYPGFWDFEPITSNCPQCETNLHSNFVRDRWSEQMDDLVRDTDETPEPNPREPNEEPNNPPGDDLSP